MAVRAGFDEDGTDTWLMVGVVLMNKGKGRKEEGKKETVEACSKG